MSPTAAAQGSSAGSRLKLAISMIEQERQNPAFDVIRELCSAAADARLHGTNEFKKLLAYVMEVADGRDRREPWTTRAGEARPVPKLRVTMEQCFGIYSDLHWFNLNKTANRSGKSLKGLFPRISAAVWRVKPEDFGDLIEALLSDAPDAALVRYLQERGGRVQGMGVEVFSRLAYAMHRDLFFVIPRGWGDSSGCLEYIGTDLRKYLAVCRNLRVVSDDLAIPEDVRGGIVLRLLEQATPPSALLEALHKAIGPALARYRSLDPGDAYDVVEDDDSTELPLEFATAAMRARRGRTDLRKALLKAYGDRCALTGNCVRDLLEVAYVLPYPTEDLHTPEHTILLRSDLHTLWDLNLIAAEPKSHRLAVAPSLVGTTYEKLAGRSLLTRVDGTTIARGALAERWRMFTASHPAARLGPVAPSARPESGMKNAGVAVRPIRGETTLESSKS